MIAVPLMGDRQEAAWHGLMDVHERLPDHWTLVGGQMVHLHCAERGVASPRPTNDADAVLDVRADPHLLRRFTAMLVELGFCPDGISAEGAQHRWVRGLAQLDVLVPEGVGERTRSRTGVTGSPTVTAPGAAQALRRSESVELSVSGRTGWIRRPSLIGALVLKAAAHSTADIVRGRHRADFLVLASVVAARDLRGVDLTPRDRQHLRRMVGATRDDRRTMLAHPGSTEALSRLERATGLA